MNFGTAVCETRERQTPTAHVSEPEAARRQLVSALGRINDEISVSEMCRGFVLNLVNHATVLCGYSELLAKQAAEGSVETRIELAERVRTTSDRLASQMSDFLNHPFFEARAVSRLPGRANACVDALSRILFGHRLFTAGACCFSARGTVPDLCFSADPIRLISGLRHLVEYCAMRIPETVSISLQVGPTSFPDRLPAASIWRIHPSRPSWDRGVVFTVATTFAAFDLVTFQRDFREGSNEPCTGNLLMLAAAISEEKLGFDINRNSSGTTVFSVYAPQPSD